MAESCGICGATRGVKRVNGFPFCSEHRVDYSASANVLAQQLENAHQDLARVRSELRVLQSLPDIRQGAATLHAHGPRTGEDDYSLLQRLSGALLLAQVAENAHSSSALHDGPATTDLRDNSRPSPGSSTHPARKRANELRSQIRKALDIWDQAVELRFAKPKRPHDDIPKVRCRVHDCPARDVWVPYWRILRGGRKLWIERCATCGTLYQPPPEEKDQMKQELA